MCSAKAQTRGRKRDRPSAQSAAQSAARSALSIALCVALCVGLTGSAALASDHEDEEDDMDQAAPAVRPINHSHPTWQPAGSFSFGVHNQGIDGSTSSSRTGSVQNNGDSLITEFFRLKARLYTPIEAHDSVLHPRLYLTGSVDIPLADNLISNRVDAIFNRTGTGQAQFPTVCPPMTGGLTTSSCTIQSRNRVTLLTQWSVGFGADLTIPVLDRQFHILTSLEYFGQLIQGGGEFTLRSNSGVQASSTDGVEIVGDAEVFHGIAPTLGIHVDVYRAAQYSIQLFIEGRAAWKYTERDLSDTGSSADLSATFRSKVRNFSVQGNGGVTILFGGYEN
jgi:hypothetical protein